MTRYRNWSFVVAALREPRPMTRSVLNVLNVLNVLKVQARPARILEAPPSPAFLLVVPGRASSIDDAHRRCDTAETACGGTCVT